MQASNSDLLLNPQSGVPAGVDGLPDTRLDSLLADAAPQKMLAGDVDERADSQLIVRTITSVMGRALRDHDDKRVLAGIASLSEVWRTGDPKAMYPVRTPDFEASLWERIAIELYALGGLSLVIGRFAMSRELTAHDPDSSTPYESWLRQGQVAGSRASTYDENVLDLAAHRLSELDPDLSEAETQAALCQFDLVSALLISEKDANGYYPNAAQYPEDLVEPLVIGALRYLEHPLRQHVWRGDNPGLRDALRRYDQKARTQAASARRHGRDWKWRAFADARTWTFVDEGHILEEWEQAGTTGWH